MAIADVRWLAALLLLAPGCILEPGISSSTTRCADSQTVADGFRLVIQNPGHLAGRCVAISHDDSRVDDAFALRKVGADGVAFLPIEGAGRYQMSVRVADADDEYCATGVGEIADHPGSGLVGVLGEARYFCH